MSRALALSVSVLAATWAATAAAAPPQLKGQYGFTGQATCQYSGQPFGINQPTVVNGQPTGTPDVPDANDFSNHTTLFAFASLPTTLPTPNGVFSNTFSVSGVRTFDGQGHGVADGQSVEVTTVSATPRASVSKFHFEFDYTIDDAGQLTTQLTPGTFTATDLMLDGVTESTSKWTIDQFSLIGLIGNNNSVITLATAKPEIETQKFTAGPQAGNQRQRVCVRSRTLIWLGN
jgi:hypothetical protein